MSPAPRSRAITGWLPNILGPALIAVAVAAGWVAIGRLADNTDRALAQTEDALGSAAKVASSSGEIGAGQRCGALTVLLVGISRLNRRVDSLASHQTI